MRDWEQHSAALIETALLDLSNRTALELPRITGKQAKTLAAGLAAMFWAPVDEATMAERARAAAWQAHSGR